jgi:diacylglycerol kinase (ATP)
MPIILNPNAGRKAGVTVNAIGRAEVEAACSAAGLDLEVIETQHAGHAAELTRAAIDDGHDTVVAAGGDGTVREVLTELIGSDVTLGILPLGSAMNVARALAIPLELTEAVTHLCERPRLATIDIGVVNDHYFVEAAGVGVTAGVFHLLGELDSGRWHRFGTLVRYLRAARSHRLWIDADGRRFTYRTLSLIAANGPLTGAVVPIAPGALMDDSLLNVRVFLAGSKPALALSWLRVLLGRAHRQPEIVELSASHVTVYGRRQQLVHADDVLAGATPTTFSIVPGAVRVIAGRDAPGLTPVVDTCRSSHRV